MSGMINNFYYGKAGQADYTPDQLPTNRVQLFFEMLRIHFSGLFGVNLMYILFCVPAIAWTLINFMAMTSTEIAEPISLIPFYLAVMVPCLGISGIGAPGLMYVLRNWARDQHAFTVSDFKENVKSNWKSGLVVGLLNGLMLMVAYVGYMTYGQMQANSAFFIVPQILVVMLCVFWWMMNMIIYPMMVTYDMKFTQLVRNSAIITMARLPWAFLIYLISLLPVVLLLIPNMYATLIFALIYVVIGFAITGLGYASFANASFDKLLNPRIEGAPVGMGLRDPNLVDDDDDIEDPNPLA